jgi:hypothetical protein
MLAAFAAFLVASQPVGSADTADVGRTAWLVATVGHSEWCPAGNVRLDLRTGGYAFTARAERRFCGKAGLEHRGMGRLRAGRLAAVRTAYLRVLTEGVESRSCRDGRGPERLILSNGGTPILLVADGKTMVSAPDNEGCWSSAATALHELLDDTFHSTQP